MKAYNLISTEVFKEIGEIISSDEFESLPKYRMTRFAKYVMRYEIPVGYEIEEVLLKIRIRYAMLQLEGEYFVMESLYDSIKEWISEIKTDMARYNLQ